MLRLLEAILSRENMQAAFKRVVGNKGAAGIDGMTVSGFNACLRHNWPCIREQQLAGAHRPQAVRKVDLPKASGGKRTLGIPTVLDRLIQQAMHQQLMLFFELHFSDASCPILSYPPRLVMVSPCLRTPEKTSDLKIVTGDQSAD